MWDTWDTNPRVCARTAGRRDEAYHQTILTQGFPRTQAEIAAELGVSDRTP